MSKKHYPDNIEDMDESTYELLGSKLSKLATESRSKNRFRERRAADRQDSYTTAPKVKRLRERPTQ
ncbi:MAG: hypothetical protein WD448_11865 [Woeseia sp.]